MDTGMHVTGIPDLVKSLKAFDKSLDKEFRKELAEIGVDVMHDAQARMPVRRARALESMKTGSNAKGAYVSGGKKSVPYYGWLDFGSRKPISGRPRSVGPWRGSGGGPARGRFLYPAIDRNRENIAKRATAAIEKVKAKLSL